jgi:hypothetical protein
MKPLIAIVTALHVLAHGMFGCCDQAAHSSTSASTPHQCVCHHADHHAHALVGVAELVETELPEQAPHECIHDSCHWVVGDSAFQLNLSDVSLTAVYSSAAYNAVGEAQAQAMWPDVDAGSLFAPPVRLHLALGVILA